MMGTIWKKLSGKKSYLGFIAAGLLGVLFALDAGLHDDPATADVTELTWLTWQQYEGCAALILAWTGVAWRHALAKAGKP